ncbi:MAG TPA: sigma-70 family RNA polymerase sigma factor [Pyrinomonadaceae bacterium]
MSSSKKIDGNAPQLDGITQQQPAPEEIVGAGKIALPPLTPETDPYLNRVANECIECKQKVEAMISSMVHSSTLAEDIVAEAIRRVYANAKLHRDEKEIENVAGMLYVTARRLVIDLKREKLIANRVKTVSWDNTENATEVNRGDDWADAHGTIGRMAAAEMLALALEGASDREKVLFDLWFNHGMTNQEIARELQVTPVTVRARLAKLIAKMRSNLGGLM